MAQRVVKVALPVDLIKRMDEALVRGQGGLSTRAEFVREAAESFLADLAFPAAPPEPSGDSKDAGPTRGERGEVSQTAASPLLQEILDAVPLWEHDELRVADLAGTALTLQAEPVTMESGIARPSAGPLLGLHNRDYPSLWAAHRLARYTTDGFISLDDFQRRATNAAWVFGRELGALEREAPTAKLQALFPTNQDKRESAERGFRHFAMGTVPKRPSRSETVEASGPLFVWGLCQLIRDEDELLVGLTPAGLRLLRDLDGLSLDLPHPQVSAERFFSYLRRNAPDDKWGFDQLLAAVAHTPTRDQLVKAVAREQDGWTPATASSIVQGYVARAREWGLIERELKQGQYTLTEFGGSALQATSSPISSPSSKESQ